MPTGDRSVAEQVADDLRGWILEGGYRPGDRLSETAITERTGVSRNSVREAYRLLAHDGLVDYRKHRGVVVHRPGPAEAHRVYQARRLLETSALREAAVARGGDPMLTADCPDPQWEQRVSVVTEAAARGQRSARAGDWLDVGTANMHLHLGLGGLLGNPELDVALRAAMTRMRLIFNVADGAHDVHGRYVEPNARLAALVAAGELARACTDLEMYLMDAERHIVRWYSEHLGQDELEAETIARL